MTISPLQCGYLHYISMYIYCMYQGDAPAPPGARLPVCLPHGGVGVGVVAEEAHPGQPQEHLGSVSPLHSTLYTLHRTLYTIYTAPCSAGCPAASWRPISRGCSRPPRCRRTRPGARECSVNVTNCLVGVLSAPRHRPGDGPPAAGGTPSR